MNRIDSARAIEKIWNVECKNGQLLYWNYNEECWSIKDDLKLLAKYKRAFEILKRELDIHCSDGEVWFCKCIGETDITKEEYKLLEELMKND